MNSGENNIDHLKIKWSSIILIENFYKNILSYHTGLFTTKRYDNSLCITYW